MTFIKTKSPVGGAHGVALRKPVPDSFLEELATWGRTAPEEIFATRPHDDPGEMDIFTLIKPTLGPWTSAAHRRAALLEVLRVLGGFESSWNWQEGRDAGNASETTLDTKSAGLWQVSNNSRSFGADLRRLLQETGIGNGDEFQLAMKDNHPFAMEYTARLLRHTIRHHGPVERGEILPFLQREAVVEFQALLGADGTQEPAAPPAAGADSLVDARSEKAIATLHPKVQPLARSLVRDAAANGIEIRVTSGTRTYAEQNELYEQGRSKPGKVVTNARGGYSNHNFGIAIDVTIFREGKPVWESPQYSVVGALGKSLGFTWGGDWQSIRDEPHFELHPPWAKGISENIMMSALRSRHAKGQDIFA